MTDVQTDGGNVKRSKNSRGEVQVLWVQTRSMAQDAACTKPYVWQTDTTFGTNRYRILSFMFYLILMGKKMSGKVMNFIFPYIRVQWLAGTK